MLLEVHPHNPQPRVISQVIKILNNDGVIIFSTDTAYSFGCSIHSKKAIKKIQAIKNLHKNDFLTLICNDTAQFQQYTKGISTPIFRKLKSLLPGPFTLIFEASKLVPKITLSKRSTIGIKVPDSPISIAIVTALNEPMLSTSVGILVSENNMHEPYELYSKYAAQVDCVVDTGEIWINPSSMLDFSVSPPELLREGAGMEEINEVLQGIF